MRVRSDVSGMVVEKREDMSSAWSDSGVVSTSYSTLTDNKLLLDEGEQ